MKVELRKWLIIVSGLLHASFCIAQSDTARAVHGDPHEYWEKNALRTHGAATALSDTCLIRPWKWELLGPATCPKEMNPGGKAIPAFAVNRGNGSGRINYLFMHPEKMHYLWACSPTGGMWFTKNGGKNWSEADTDQLPVSGISSVSVNRKNTRQWVVATGDGDDQFMFSDGIWRSFNGGKTYHCLNGEDPATSFPAKEWMPWLFVSEVFTKPDDFSYVAVACNRGFWVCENAGRKKFLSSRFSPRQNLKWKRIAEGNFYDILSFQYGNQNALAVGGDKFLLSLNGGEEWKEIPLPDEMLKQEFPFRRMTLDHSPASPATIYALTTCSEKATQSKAGPSQLWTYDLRTEVWKMVRELKGDAPSMIPTRARAFAVSPVNSNHHLCGNVQPVHFSNDGAKTFAHIERNQMHDDLHHLLFAPDGKTVWAANDGGVSKSTDGGLHWEHADEGICAANVFGLSVAQQKETQVAFGGYDTGGNLLREHAWWHVSFGDGFETITSPSNPDVIFTTMQNGQIQASYTGESFEESMRSGSKVSWHTWIRMHPTKHQTIYCSGQKLMRSDNLGLKWESIFSCTEKDSLLETVWRFYTSEAHPNVLYLYALDKGGERGPQIWRTMDASLSPTSEIVWEKIPEPPVKSWVMSIEADPRDPSRFWLLYNKPEGNEKLYYFNGTSYENLSSGLPSCKCESMRIARGDEARLYIGCLGGVYTRSREEDQWTLLDGLPGCYIPTIDFNYASGKIVVGTFGRGIWQADLLRDE